MIPLRTIAQLFLRLGITAFGGPAAHIAMLHQEVVRRHRWISEEEFAQLIAITNLLPGPNSTEMAMHVGRRVAGWPGFVVAGTAFILPAALLVSALAVFYVQYGRTPDVRAVMTAMVPVIIAIIAHATIGLARSTLQDVIGWVVAGVAAALSLAGFNELVLLLIGGLAAVVTARRTALAATLMSVPGLVAQGTAAPIAAVALPDLFLFFLKIGSVLFGSGYVLVAFLHGDLVDRWGWLTEQQLIDAIAVGQITPGPLSTTATFIGYLLRGPEGAVLATIGIFLPAFVFVALAQVLMPILLRSALVRRFLHGIVAASLGLMAAVALTLARTSLTGVLPIAGTIIALAVLIRWNVNAAWLVLAAALLGFVGAAL